MSQDDKQLRKEAMKEALREWLDEEKKKTLQSLGSWALNTFTILLITALVIFMIKMDGWSKH